MKPRHYRIGPSIWLEPWDDDIRLVAFYLLTCPHRKTEGLFRLPLSYAAGDMGWKLPRFRRAFEKLLDVGFIEYDDQAQVLLIVKALKWQPTSNAKHALSAVRALSDVPQTPLFARFRQLAHEHDKWLHKALREHYPEPSPEPLPTGSPEPSPIPYAEGSGISPSLTPSLPPLAPQGGNGGGEVVRLEKRVTHNRRPVPPERVDLAERVLADFNQQAGTNLGAWTGAGKASESLQRIIGALTDWPDRLDKDTCSRVIGAALKSRWWGAGPPSVGVVFGPRVIEQNLARATGHGREKTATEKVREAYN